MRKVHFPSTESHYDINYGNFQAELYAEIRRAAFGEDIGQNSWHTTKEQDQFITWLNLAAGKSLLDVACGAGGPALRIAQQTGCSVVGVEIHERAVETARSLAVARGLETTSRFLAADASQPLPLGDQSFDAITCIDAINHFRDRAALLREWARLLKPGGRILFTDPIVVSGPLGNDEIAIRTSAGFYLVVPRGYDELTIAECGFQLLLYEDVTANMEKVAGSRHTARAARSVELRKIEGDEVFAAEQQFLEVTARLASEGRLSRFVFVAAKAH